MARFEEPVERDHDEIFAYILALAGKQPERHAGGSGIEATRGLLRLEGFPG